MHFKGASTDTLALKNALDANASANMWIGTSTSTTIYELSITPLDGTSATIVYPVTGAKWAGTMAHSDYSPASAAVISLKTATRGRRARGRLFIPFQQEAAITNGTIPGALTTFQTAWDTFRTAMTTALYPLVIASYGHSLHKTKTSGGGFTMTPVTWTPDSYVVTSATIESTLGTMRRRQSRLR